MNYNEGIAGWCLAILWKCNMFLTLIATPNNCEMLLLHSAEHFVRWCFGFFFFVVVLLGGVLDLLRHALKAARLNHDIRQRCHFFKTAETWERTLKRALKTDTSNSF